MQLAKIVLSFTFGRRKEDHFIMCPELHVENLL